MLWVGSVDTYWLIVGGQFLTSLVLHFSSIKWEYKQPLILKAVVKMG